MLECAELYSAPLSLRLCRSGHRVTVEAVDAGRGRVVSATDTVASLLGGLRDHFLVLTRAAREAARVLADAAAEREGRAEELLEKRVGATEVVAAAHVDVGKLVERLERWLEIQMKEVEEVLEGARRDKERAEALRGAADLLEWLARVVERL